MKIISYLNVSNASNIEADSGFVFQVNLLSELKRIGWQVFLIVPDNIQLPKVNIEFIKIKIPESKYGVRFGLDWIGLSLQLEMIGICDVFLNNQCELTASFKLLLFEVWGKLPIIATYFHYLSVESYGDEIIYDKSLNLFGSAKRIFELQLDSAQISDVCFIGSEFGKKMLLSACNMPSKVNIEVLPPPIDESKKFQFEKKLSSENTLLYNHRLYNHYGGVKIFEWLEELNKEVPITVIVTDPTGKRSQKRNRLDSSVFNLKNELTKYSFIKIVNAKSRDDYHRLLQKADIGIGHLRVGALWSMSIMDMMSFGKPVVALKQDGAIEEVIQDTELLLNNKDEFLDTLKKIVTNNNFYKKKAAKVKERSTLYTPAIIANKFINVIQKFL